VKNPFSLNPEMPEETPEHCPLLLDLAQRDPEVFRAIEAERQRQAFKLELIASENFVSPAVRAAQGSVLTHKYAEGYPGRRYYGGCEHVDTVEDLAISRAKELFGARYVNVQPHSGTQANMAVYFTFLKPGDIILGMDLAHGGHLSHGAAANFSGRCQRLPPDPGFRQVCGDCPGGGGPAAGGHGPHRRSGGRRSASQPGVGL